MNTAEQETSKNVFTHIGLIIRFCFITVVYINIIQELRLHQFDCDYLV